MIRRSGTSDQQAMSSSGERRNTHLGSCRQSQRRNGPTPHKKGGRAAVTHGPRLLPYLPTPAISRRGASFVSANFREMHHGCATRGFLPGTNEIWCQLESVTCVAMETASLPQICPFVSRHHSDTVSSSVLKKEKRILLFPSVAPRAGRH